MGLRDQSQSGKIWVCETSLCTPQGWYLDITFLGQIRKCPGTIVQMSRIGDPEADGRVNDIDDNGAHVPLGLSEAEEVYGEGPKPADVPDHTYVKEYAWKQDFLLLLLKSK